MKGKVFGVLCNGEIEIQITTKEYLEKALDVLEKSFYLYEKVCRGTEINLPEQIESRKELTNFCRIVAEDGISLMARHVPTDKVIGVAFNKIQIPAKDNEETFFDLFIRTQCKTPNARSLLEYMAIIDGKFNVFEHYNIDCLMEIVFLSTLQEFGGKGVATALCQYSIQLARNLMNGQDLEFLNEKLKDKRPKAIAATFTSRISQAVGKKLKMDFLLDVPYTEFSFNGKTYAERIGPEHPSGILCAKKL